MKLSWLTTIGCWAWPIVKIAWNCSPGALRECVWLYVDRVGPGRCAGLSELCLCLVGFLVQFIAFSYWECGVWTTRHFHVESDQGIHSFDGWWYTVSHWECGQFRHYVHENFEKFEMISTSTGSWIRRDRIQLPVDVEIISNFSKFSWT